MNTKQKIKKQHIHTQKNQATFINDTTINNDNNKKKVEIGNDKYMMNK